MTTVRWNMNYDVTLLLTDIGWHKFKEFWNNEEYCKSLVCEPFMETDKTYKIAVKIQAFYLPVIFGGEYNISKYISMFVELHDVGKE